MAVSDWPSVDLLARMTEDLNGSWARRGPIFVLGYDEIKFAVRRTPSTLVSFLSGEFPERLVSRIPNA